MEIHKLVGYQRKVVSFVVLLLCIVCLFIVSAGAEENKWYLYYTEPDGIEHYYDSKSIIRTSKTIPKTKASTKRRVRTTEKYTKVLLVKVREKLVFNNPEYPLKESRIVREIDCSKNMIRTLMTSETYKTGLKKIEGKTRYILNIFSFICPNKTRNKTHNASANSHIQ